MAFTILISALLGAVFGSFTSMACYRIPRDEGIIHGRSHCPICKHILGVKDLFPVVSWLFTRGKCRYCHTPFGISYILHELSLSLLFVLIFLVYGYSPLTLVLWAVAICLVILIAIDIEHYYLPDRIQIPLALLAVTYCIFSDTTIIGAIIGCITYFSLGYLLRLIGFAIKNIEAFGWGDIKFFGIVGIFLGIDPLNAAMFCFLSGVAGIITAFIWKQSGKGEVFPFGPALAAALMTLLLLNSNTYWIRPYMVELISF